MNAVTRDDDDKEEQGLPAGNGTVVPAANVRMAMALKEFQKGRDGLQMRNVA